MADVITQANELTVFLAFTVLCLAWQNTFLLCELFLGGQISIHPIYSTDDRPKKGFQWSLVWWSNEFNSLTAAQLWCGGGGWHLQECGQCMGSYTTEENVSASQDFLTVLASGVVGLVSPPMLPGFNVMVSMQAISCWEFKKVMANIMLDGPYFTTPSLQKGRNLLST